MVIHFLQQLDQPVLPCLHEYVRLTSHALLSTYEPMYRYMESIMFQSHWMRINTMNSFVSVRSTHARGNQRIKQHFPCFSFNCYRTTSRRSTPNSSWFLFRHACPWSRATRTGTVGSYSSKVRECHQCRDSRKKPMRASQCLEWHSSHRWY